MISTAFMTNFRKLAVFLLAFAVLTASDVLACTTFCLKNKGEVLFGKNYDWMIGDGMIFVNKRGVSKMSAAEKNPARWNSKYGSITFNQYGREAPSGGMNEAGLVIELMWLDDTRYPQPDNRAEVDVLEWIQYNLDTAASVADVIKSSETIRISSPVKLHYLTSDREGNSATIEFLDGRLVAHTGSDLPVATLTNNTYASSMDFAGKANSVETYSASSLDRFARASKKTSEFAAQAKNEREAVDYAFDILADAAQKGYTQWSIIYDQKRGRIYFRTRKSTAIKSLDLNSFDYTCGSAVKMLDIDTTGSGDAVSRFRDYSRAENRDLIERAFNGTDFLKNVPGRVRDQYANIPDKFSCAGPVPVKKETVSKSADYLGIVIRYCISLYLATG
jgi:choloylglycine hydrolase